jgi:hypothetical protein
MKALRNSLVAAVGFAILVGALVLGGPQVVRAANGGAVCPCFTSAMIDAGLVSLGVDVSDLSISYCQGTVGIGVERNEVGFELCDDPEDCEDATNVLTVETGFGPLPPPGEPPPILGLCSIEVQRGDDPLFSFTLGSGEEDLSAAQVAACQREILNSFTWRRFLAPEECLED